jgi:poly(3-hydroxyoctanoate) depolymerase
MGTDTMKLVRNTSIREMNIRQINVYGTTIRVAVWPGDRAHTPLILFNGIGASLELLVPFADVMGDVEVIAFDVPGVGESSQPPVPYRMWMLAMLAGRLLTQLGYDQVDALGVSWGGALAQQFALQNPTRCRRLILAATSQGVLMVPGKLSVLAKFFTARRHNDSDYRQAIAGEIYGGKARTGATSIDAFRKTSKRGYLLQQAALAGWTSLPWLPLLRQPTLIMSGDDDPVIPLVNAKVLNSLIRNSRLHVFNDGHLFLISEAAEAGRIVRDFVLLPEGAFA